MQKCSISEWNECWIGWKHDKKKRGNNKTEPHLIMMLSEEPKNTHNHTHAFTWHSIQNQRCELEAELMRSKNVALKSPWLADSTILWFIYWTSLKIARELSNCAQKQNREGWNRCEGQAKGGGGGMGNDNLLCVCVITHELSFSHTHTLWRISHVFELNILFNLKLMNDARVRMCVYKPKLIECEQTNQTKWNGMSSKAHHTHKHTRCVPNCLHITEWKI